MKKIYLWNEQKYLGPSKNLKIEQHFVFNPSLFFGRIAYATLAYVFMMFVRFQVLNIYPICWQTTCNTVLKLQKCAVVLAFKKCVTLTLDHHLSPLWTLIPIIDKLCGVEFKLHVFAFVIILQIFWSYLCFSSLTVSILHSLSDHRTPSWCQAISERFLVGRRKK